MQIRLALSISLSIAVLAFAAPALAESVSRWIYEDIKNVRCEDRPERDLKHLSQAQLCNVNGSNLSVATLSAEVEKSFFGTLAQRERMALQCAGSTLRALIQSKTTQNLAIESTCKRLDLVKLTAETLQTLDQEIESYKTLTDRMLRPIPEEEYQKNLTILSRLKKERERQKAILTSITQSDILLSNHETTDWILGLLRKSNNSRSTCEALKKEMPQRLKNQNESVKTAYHDLKNATAATDRISSQMRSTLWRHFREHPEFKTLNENPELHRSFLCRMEAEYGEGATIRDKLANIALLAAPSAILGTGKIAASLLATRFGKAAQAARAATLIETSLGLTMSYRDIARSCESNPDSFASEKACSDAPEAGQTLALSQINEGNCILSLTLGALTGGSAAITIGSHALGVLPERILGRLAGHNNKLIELAGEAGIYDDIITVGRTATPEGQIVTVARKPGAKHWFDPNYNRRPSLVDPVGDPTKTVLNLDKAGSKLGFQYSGNAVQFPDAKFFTSKIDRYNQAAPKDKQIAVRYYEFVGSPTESLTVRTYIDRFVRNGELPVGRPASGLDSVANSSHLYLHDMTLHSNAITIPAETIRIGQTGIKKIFEFKDQLKQSHPNLYQLLEKERIWDRIETDVSRSIDFSTGLWTHFLSNARAGLQIERNSTNASYALFGYNQPTFMSANSAEQVFKQFSHHFSPYRFSDAQKQELETAMNAFLKKQDPSFRASVIPSPVKTEQERLEYFYRRHQELTESIASRLN